MPLTEVIPSAPAELRQLRARLVATRARLLLAQTSTGLARAAAVLIGAFAAEMTLDFLAHLPWPARACFSLAALAGAGWILRRETLLPLLRIPDDHAVACAVERALPVFQTRLIAAIQLGAADASKKSALVGALIRETAAIAADHDFRKAVRTEKLIRALRVLACVLAAACVLAWLGRGNVSLLLERALLLTARLPSRTRIESVQCPAKIAQGQDLAIDVQATGALPESGAIIARGESRTSEYKLERDPAKPAWYHATIRGATESVTLTAQLNDATSNPVKVTVLAPPAVLAVQCIEVYPAYTKLPPEARPTGDLTLLAGSVLKVAVTSSAALSQASVHLAGLDKDLPFGVTVENPQQARGDIPIPKQGLTGFSVRLIDVNGIPSRETAVYQIDIVPDMPPSIKITQPAPEEVATAQADEVIAFQAEDDFGVASVFLHYMVNQSAERVIEFDLGGETPRHLERRFEWKLAPMHLAPGASIDYWLEAVDANNVTGPGHGFTEHARIRIVTDDEKRAELARRMDDALGSLDQMSRSEDDLSRQVGRQIFEKATGGAQ